MIKPNSSIRKAVRGVSKVSASIMLLAIFLFAIPVQMAVAVILPASTITVNNVKINLSGGLNNQSAAGLNCTLGTNGTDVNCEIAPGTAGAP